MINKSNEELAICIQAGVFEFIPVLWSRLDNLMYWHCNRYYRANMEACAASGITCDDLCQEAYFVFLDVIRAYDESKGYNLTAYIHYSMLCYFDSLTGRRGKAKPLNGAESLEKQIDRDIRLMDTIQDNEAYNAFRAVEDAIYTGQLRADLNACMAKLSDEQAAAIRCKYFGGSGKPSSRHYKDAIKRLRRYDCISIIKEYEQDIISRYGYKSSLSMWKAHGDSSTERAAIKLLCFSP